MNTKYNTKNTYLRYPYKQLTAGPGAPGAPTSPSLPGAPFKRLFKNQSGLW